DWLDGIVHGPQVLHDFPELRKNIPAKYPIRRYPDITHSRGCQYPVPNWDKAYQRTLDRESINPRPMWFTEIYRKYRTYAAGFITYSEGCNDDVNKILWSCLGWDPKMNVREIMKDYSNYFISSRYADRFADGLLALEKNWQGPLLENNSVYKTLEHFQKMEKEATPQDKLNWRFQQGLYRAYYDAYVKARLHYETELEARAKDVLKNAKQLGSLKAIDQAEAILDKAVTQKIKTEWRARTFELAEALFQSIRMQLSVKKYQAIRVVRGANLDNIDVPLNNSKGLKKQFAEIRKLKTEKERLIRIGLESKMPVTQYSGPRDKLHIYLLIGQSNMAGRAAIPDEDKGPMEGCFLLDRENRWEPASNPLNRYSTLGGSLKNQRLNPGYMFAKTMRKNNPNVSIGLICNARGATSIEKWMPGTDYYKQAIKRVKAAWDTGVFKGVLWHQGEGNDTNINYHVKLKKLIAQMRKDLGHENMFFVAGGIVESETLPRGKILNPQLARLPGEVPFTGFASSEGLKTFDGKAHFGSESMKTLGRRYAEAIIELEKEGTKALSYKQAASTRDVITNSIGMKLVYIPAGEFMMGSGLSTSQVAFQYGGNADSYKDEHPQHKVRISKGFYMCQTEVTQAQYEMVMGINPSFFKGDNLPVETVRWTEVTEFCKKLSLKDGKTYRLPTEAEWEYACRAGSTGAYSFGNSQSSLGDYAWYGYEKSGKRTHPVGTKRPNAFGLYDMHGNVWEFCRDFYDRGYYNKSIITDPEKNHSNAIGRVLRGGGWDSNAGICRSAYRFGNHPKRRSGSFGFRVVFSVSPQDFQ
ncbi:MAG: sialate O-acetylesterase, partial [Planctomycetota bacterium]